jgi:hypothetical protein
MIPRDREWCISAEVILIPTERGGRKSPAVFPYRPQVSMGSFSVSCLMECYDDGVDMMEFGVSYKVRLWFFTIADNKDYKGPPLCEIFPVGTDLIFFEGSRRVATGLVVPVA